MAHENLVDDFGKIKKGDILFSGWEKGEGVAIEWVTEADEDGYMAKTVQFWYGKWWVMHPMQDMPTNKNDVPDDFLLRHAKETDLRKIVHLIFISELARDD